MQYTREAVRIATQKIALANAERAAARLEADIQAYGEDTHANGTVWSFSKTYSEFDNSKTYSYAALKADGRWFMTGTSGARTYDELVMFLLTEGNAVQRKDIVELTAAK